MLPGTTVKVLTHKGVEIRKVVSRVAYARNGNGHNPTVTYRWEAWKNGRCVGTASRLREVKDDIDNGLGNL